MNPVVVHPGASPLAAAPASPRRGGATGFADFMRVSMEQHGTAAGSREEQAKIAANQLVSVAFIKPLLAQMHQSPFKTDLLHGGQGEAVFQEHLDTVLADRVAGRLNVSLADAIYRRIAGIGSLNAISPTSPNVIKPERHG